MTRPDCVPEIVELEVIMDFDIKVYEDKMEKTLSNLQEDYVSIRAGRANPHILDKIQVDYYGTPSPLQSVANVSVPEARMILIQPWEASLIKEIEKSDPFFRSGTHTSKRRKSNPSRISGADRGAEKGTRKGCKEKG